jgi:hypothetical protein
MAPLIKAVIVAGAACMLSAAAGPATAATPGAPERIVVYPSAKQSNDDRGNYYVSLLKLALSKVDGAIEVRPSEEASVTLRAFARMAAGEGIDVIWAPASIPLEQQFRRIPVPLDKGILGWRLLLINGKDRERFASISSLDQLRTLPAGQVTEWVDTQILRANGLPVVDATLYENLFPMLAAKRFRYLPRGIAEISGEVRNNAKRGLVIEPHLALHYPQCTYFFVARANTELADQIERGLQRAIKDGSFEKLFQHHNGAAIQAADLGRRTVFELGNPSAPAGTFGADGECLGSAAVAPLAPPSH